MSFVGRNGYIPHCAFSKKLIVNGTCVKDIFASLYHILKMIVYHELTTNGILNINHLTEHDLRMLKDRMLEYGIDLVIETHNGKFQPAENCDKLRLKDHLIILSSENGYTKMYFDYACLSAEPHHLE